MSTTNNNTANFTVENLVAKYREYVSKHCSYCVNACEGKNGKMIEVCAPISPDANADEQLLVTLYSCVTGSEADKNVMNALSGYVEKYQKEALTEEEFVFLSNNFKELVAYEFSHRTEWGWESAYKSNEDTQYLPHLSHHTHNDVPALFLDIIKKKPEQRTGQTVFIADAGYCDVAVQFPNCIIKGFTHHKDNWINQETWALGQIRLYAAGVKSEILPCNEDIKDWQYISDVDYALWGFFNEPSYEGIVQSFQHMKANSSMMLLMDRKDVIGCTSYKSHDLLDLRMMLVKEKYINSIVSFDGYDNYRGFDRQYICLFANKSVNTFVYVNAVTLEKEMELSADMLDADILWPGYYFANKPENGIPLSEIASYEKMISVYNILEDEDVTFDAIKDELILSDRARKILNMFSVATPADMATNYKDSNLCNTNLKESGNSVLEGKGGWIKIITKPCVLLYGKKDKCFAGYVNQISDKLATLLDPEPTLALNEGMATLGFVPCISPKDGIDVRYIAALLLSPEIKEQIITICEGNVDNNMFPLIMDKVTVANHTEKERLSFLSEANYNALVSAQNEMKEKYEREIVELNKIHQDKLENYQHGMRKPIREIGSAIRRMERYIRENIVSAEIKDYLLQRTTHIKNHKESLSEDIERLNEENTYGEPIVFDIDHCLKSYINYFGKDIEIRYQNEISKRLIEHYKASKDYLNLKMIDRPAALDAKIHELSTIFVDIAEYNFNKIVKRILDNADDHGFSNTTPEKCIIEINLDWDNDMEKFRIDFRNNGTPFPKGLSKEIYGEYKRYGGKTGKTGIGGYEVADNVRHYGGDFILFQDKDWAVIRIFLPKSKAYERL